MRSNEPIFGRVLTAMITPFDAVGNVDYAEAGRIAQWLTEHGSDGLVVTGTTGESATLSLDEKMRMYETVVQAVQGQAKVLAGTGTYDTAETVELSRAASEIGIDGLLVVTPYYNKPSQEGLYQHYAAVAGASALPVSRTDAMASPSLLWMERLALRAEGEVDVGGRDGETAARDLLTRVFGGSVYGLVSHLLRHENVSADEMRRLRELIDES